MNVRLNLCVKIQSNDEKKEKISGEKTSDKDWSAHGAHRYAPKFYIACQNKNINQNKNRNKRREKNQPNQKQHTKTSSKQTTENEIMSSVSGRELVSIICVNLQRDSFHLKCCLLLLFFAFVSLFTNNACHTFSFRIKAENRHTYLRRCSEMEVNSWISTN